MAGITGLSRVDTQDFEPMEVDGEAHGEVHWVRNEEGDGGVYRSAVWRMPAGQLPYRSRYDFENDETIVVLYGTLRITFDDGGELVLSEGDVVSMAAGTGSTWAIDEPFAKFVVETDRRGA